MASLPWYQQMALLRQLQLESKKDPSKFCRSSSSTEQSADEGALNLTQTRNVFPDSQPFGTNFNGNVQQQTAESSNQLNTLAEAAVCLAANQPSQQTTTAVATASSADEQAILPSSTARLVAAALLQHQQQQNQMLSAAAAAAATAAASTQHLQLGELMRGQISALQERLQLNLLHQAQMMQHLTTCRDKKLATTLQTQIQQLSFEQQHLVQQLQSHQRNCLLQSGVGAATAQPPDSTTPQVAADATKLWESLFTGGVSVTAGGGHAISAPMSVSAGGGFDVSHASNAAAAGVLPALIAQSRLGSSVSNPNTAADLSLALQLQTLSSQLQQQLLQQQLQPAPTHPLYQRGICAWPNCELQLDSFSAFLQHITTVHTLNDKSTAQCRVQMQVVDQLESQLTKERARWQAMMQHLQMKQSPDTTTPSNGFLVSSSSSTAPITTVGCFTADEHPMESPMTSPKSTMTPPESSTMFTAGGNVYNTTNTSNNIGVNIAPVGNDCRLVVPPPLSVNTFISPQLHQSQLAALTLTAPKLVGAQLQLSPVPTIIPPHQSPINSPTGSNSANAQHPSAVNSGVPPPPSVLSATQQDRPTTGGAIRRRVSDKGVLPIAADIARNREFYRTHDVRPPYTYASLIRQAVMEAKDNQLTLNEVYNWFQDTFAYFRRNAATWKNAVRHNLSLHKCFTRVENVKGAVWTVDDTEYYKRRPQRVSTTQAPNAAELIAAQQYAQVQGERRAATPDATIAEFQIRLLASPFRDTVSDVSTNQQLVNGECAIRLDDATPPQINSALTAELNTVDNDFPTATGAEDSDVLTERHQNTGDQNDGREDDVNAESDDEKMSPRLKIEEHEEPIDKEQHMDETPSTTDEPIGLKSEPKTNENPLMNAVTLGQMEQQP